MISSFIYLLSIVNLAIYFYVIFLVARKAKFATTYRRFVLLNILTVFWVVDSLLEREPVSFEFYRFLVYFNYSLAALIASFVASFALHFPSSNRNFLWKKEIFFFLPPVILSFLSFSNLFVEVTPVHGFEAGPYYLVYFFILFIYFFLIAGVVLVKKFKRSVGIQKNQLKFFLFGYLLAITILLSESLYFNVIGQVSPSVDQLLANSSILFSALAAYSILRYRFLDIRIVIQKGIIQLLTFGVLFGIYTYLILFLQNTVKNEYHISDQGVLIISVFLIVITIEPLRRFIYRIIDRMFENRERMRQESLRRLELISKSTLHFHTLVGKVTDELAKVFQRKVAFAVLNRQLGLFESQSSDVPSFSLADSLSGYIEKGRILVTDELPYRIEEGEASLEPVLESAKQKKFSLVMPMGSDDELIGMLVFLEEKGKPVFTSDEITMIKNFSSQITLTFAGALAYKQALERVMK